jgi:DNA topoisomerase-6 subunit B
LCSEEISQKRLNTLRGIANHERKDEALYQDYETETERAKRLAKEAKEFERLEKQAAKKGESLSVVEAKKKELLSKHKAAQAGKGEKVFFRVTVRDNGCGMSHEDIPKMLGQVLSGTKYGIKQTRGKFGLGAKMALIWSKMSTGLPITVTSATRGSSQMSYYELDIDIQRNQPNVHVEKRMENADRWHGAELSVVIAGNWQYYRSKVLKYLQQIAVITPYAEFTFKFIAECEKGSFQVLFARRTDVMPEPPKATKHHPSSVDLELIKRLTSNTKAPTLSSFLCKEFAGISRDLAGRIIEEMRSGAEPHMAPDELTERHILRLHQLLHEVRFPDPDGGHLSPAGEYNLRLGVMKELHPELVATSAGSVGVHEGHAFVVEAAVSVGGRDVKPGINIYRFANRIPLLFEGGSDVITRTAMKRINWGSYKINQTTDKIGVFVSLVSTKIPFKGAGKEYIADDVQEIQNAVRSSIQQCCVQLKQKIVRAQAARERRQRKKNLSKYIPNIAAAVHTVLRAMVEPEQPRAAKRQRRDGNDRHTGILSRVSNGSVTEELLAKMLTDHVEQIDMSMALEYQVQQGIAQGMKVDSYLVPAGPQHLYSEGIHTQCAALRFLKM